MDETEYAKVLLIIFRILLVAFNALEVLRFNVRSFIKHTTWLHLMPWKYCALKYEVSSNIPLGCF